VDETKVGLADARPKNPRGVRNRQKVVFINAFCCRIILIVKDVERTAHTYLQNIASKLWPHMIRTKILPSFKVPVAPGLLVMFLASAVWVTNTATAQGTNGIVVSWGNSWGTPPTTAVFKPEIRFTAIAASYGGNSALTQDGTVVPFGMSDFGQAEVPVGLREVVAISEGGYHVLALKQNGTVSSWGANWYGRGLDC
jgi:hypothetical protein